MSFLIKDDKLLEKCNEIWETVRNGIRSNFWVALKILGQLNLFHGLVLEMLGNSENFLWV